MSNLTRSKIAYDLNIPPHNVTLEYKNGETLKFVFSSELYREKFSARVNEHREQINRSLSNRFGFNIIQNKLADLKLYITIEKRGFLIYKGLVKMECLNDIILDGQNLTSKN
jgi:hypothetical protein